MRNIRSISVQSLTRQKYSHVRYEIFLTGNILLSEDMSQHKAYSIFVFANATLIDILIFTDVSRERRRRKRSTNMEMLERSADMPNALDKVTTLRSGKQNILHCAKHSLKLIVLLAVYGIAKCENTCVTCLLSQAGNHIRLLKFSISSQQV